MIGIYKIENLTNHKVYVGQSVHIERRWTEHCQPSSKSLVGKVIQKYGKENFSFQILEECQIEQLNQKEKYYIEFYNSVVPNGYNIMEFHDGYQIGYSIDKDTLSNIVSEIQNTEETFQAIAEKYSISTRTITRINQGYTYHNEDLVYPLRKQINLPDSYCIDCGCKIGKQSIRCKKCNDIYQRKVERPDREYLKQLIRNFSFTKIGEQYGVSDNAIRKWCDKYNLPRRKKDINKISNKDWENI